MLRAVPAVVAFLLLGSTAQAYLLPTEYLLRLLADRRRQITVKDVTAQLSTEAAGVDSVLDEQLYLKSPERLRLVSQADDGANVLIEREGQQAQGPERSPQRLAKSTDLTAILLFPSGKDVDEATSRLLHVIKAAGIDTSIVSLGRLDDTPAYIIGARPWETDKPQVWLYKSTYLPMRVIVNDTSRSPAVRVELRYLEFGSGAAGDYLPAVMERYEDGRRVRRAEVIKVVTNQSLPETLFDMPKR